MLIRPANKEDFERVLGHKELTYYSWDFVESVSKILSAKNGSVYIEFDKREFILPLIIQKVFGFYPVAFSMPFGLYGGLIGDQPVDKDSYLALMRKAQQYVGHGIVFQNVFDEEIISSVFEPVKKVFTHVVDLDKINYDEYARDNFSHGMKEGVKKALKNQILIKAGNSSQLVNDFYKVYLLSSLSWGKKKPRYGPDFFANFVNKEYFEVRIAYYNNAPLGGLAMLRFNRYYFDWFAGMDKELRNTRANEYLHADLIRAATENKFHMINFGASAGLMGVQLFKESLGAVSRSYSICHAGNTFERIVLSLILRIFY